MLTLVVPPASLGQALAHGTVLVRPPRSVQVLLSGRTPPVRVRARRGARAPAPRPRRHRAARGGVARRARRRRVRRAERALALRRRARASSPALAPQLGAAAALFVSDERTEVFLRDQRRSKAHRALAPDAGAPCEEVVNVDLGAVDPLLLDEKGQVRVGARSRGAAGHPGLLGGDGGRHAARPVRGRDAAQEQARPARGSTSCSPVPSRQMLEVLASAGALTDLIADRRPPRRAGRARRLRRALPSSRRGPRRCAPATPSRAPAAARAPSSRRPRRSRTRSPRARWATRARSSARCASRCRARCRPTTCSSRASDARPTRRPSRPRRPAPRSPRRRRRPAETCPNPCRGAPRRRSSSSTPDSSR